MRSVTVHAVLLAVALPVAYLTWTRNPDMQLSERAIPIWRGDADGIVTVTLDDRLKHMVIERKSDAGGDYLWGTRTRTGPILAADSASNPMIAQVRDSVGFLVSVDDGPKVLGLLAVPAAIRDLGEPSADSMLAAYGFRGADTARVRVSFGGLTHELLIGGQVFGGEDRYVMAPPDRKVYVLPGQYVTVLLGGDQTLSERRYHVYTKDRMAKLILTDQKGATKTFVNQSQLGSVIQWALESDPDTPDINVSNVIGQMDDAGLVSYRADVDPAQVTRLLRADFLDAAGDSLGFLEFYEKPGANPGEHYLRTEHTRVLIQAYEEVGTMLKGALTRLF